MRFQNMRDMCAPKCLCSVNPRLIKHVLDHDESFMTTRPPTELTPVKAVIPICITLIMLGTLSGLFVQHDAVDTIVFCCTDVSALSRAVAIVVRYRCLLNAT